MLPRAQTQTQLDDTTEKFETLSVIDEKCVSHLNVLIVEDNSVLSLKAKTFFEKLGYDKNKIHVVKRCDEAYKHYEKGEYHIVYLDNRLLDTQIIEGSQTNTGAQLAIKMNKIDEERNKNKDKDNQFCSIKFSCSDDEEYQDGTPFEGVDFGLKKNFGKNDLQTNLDKMLRTKNLPMMRKRPEKKESAPVISSNSQESTPLPLPEMPIRGFSHPSLLQNRNSPSLFVNTTEEKIQIVEENNVKGEGSQYVSKK